jgi:hypothetical protein
MFWRWREGIVEVLVGSSAVAIWFAALDASVQPIVGAIALIGIALAIAGDIGPQPLQPPVEVESPRATLQPTSGFDPAIADATSV